MKRLAFCLLLLAVGGICEIDESCSVQDVRDSVLRWVFWLTRFVGQDDKGKAVDGKVSSQERLHQIRACCNFEEFCWRRPLLWRCVLSKAFAVCIHFRAMYMAHYISIDESIQCCVAIKCGSNKCRNNVDDGSNPCTTGTYQPNFRFVHDSKPTLQQH